MNENTVTDEDGRRHRIGLARHRGKGEETERETSAIVFSCNTRSNTFICATVVHGQPLTYFHVENDFMTFKNFLLTTNDVRRSPARRPRRYNRFPPSKARTGRGVHSNRKRFEKPLATVLTGAPLRFLRHLAWGRVPTIISPARTYRRRGSSAKCSNVGGARRCNMFLSRSP